MEMESLFNLIAEIPNVIWSAIIASFVTLFGVWLTNKGNHKRQMALLDHEKEKFQTEQKQALKKEVYLSMASSLSSMLGIIHNFSDLNLSQTEINERVREHGNNIAKSYLVAKENSVKEILNFDVEMGKVFLDLIKDRAVLLDHQKAIKIYKSTINSAEEEKNRILAIMKELNLQQANNEQTSNYLNDSWKLQDKIIKENTSSMEKEISILNSLLVNFIKKSNKESSRLLTLLPSMVIALRNELENDGNSKVFSEIIKEYTLKRHNLIDSVFDDS